MVCATLDDTPGFGFLDENANHLGFDIDLCRAVAAATLGDADAVELRTIDAAERGPIVQAGEVDLLVFVTTWTSSRDASWGDFVPTMFYDGQGFMVPDRLEISSAYGLGGASVCTVSGTTSELNMEDFFRQNRMEYSPVIFETVDLALDAYANSTCDVFTTDIWGRTASGCPGKAAGTPCGRMPPASTAQRADRSTPHPCGSAPSGCLAST